MSDDLQGDVRFLADLEVGVDLPVARLGSRALAQIVDLAILFTVGIALVFMTGFLSALTGGSGVFFAILIVGQFLVYWGYFFLWELLASGQTPGKRLAGLRVVHTDGTNLGPAACLVRNLLRVVDVLPFGYGVGSVAVLLTQRAQRLGDLAAGTLVVREDRRAAPERPLRWPDGVRPEDVALVETYFAEAPTLLPARREAIADRLVELLTLRYPGFLHAEAGWSSGLRIERSFREPDAGA